MGWNAADEEYRADHYRDERKHDFPTIRRLEPKVTTALEIAILVKNLPNVTEGAQLIEQYAHVVAACVRADDATERYNKLAVANESPLTPKKPAGHYGEMCMNPSLCAGKGYCPRDPNCAD